MNPTPQWVPEAAELLSISKSTLKAMRRDRRLEPGTHWIYATGTPNGPVVYNLTAIREYLAQRTKQMVQQEAQRRAAEQQQKQQSIETYSEAGLEELIAEVQN